VEGKTKKTKTNKKKRKTNYPGNTGGETFGRIVRDCKGNKFSGGIVFPSMGGDLEPGAQIRVRFFCGG